MSFWEIAVIVLVMNLPFGYWRANVGRYSLQWFLAIHLPVAPVVALRALSGVGWQLDTLPLLVAVFFGGQLLGIRLYLWRRKRARTRVTSCLVMDVVRGLQGSYGGSCK